MLSWAHSRKLFIILDNYFLNNFKAISQLIDRIRRVQAQNNQLFTILNNYTDTNMEPVVRHFPPPVYQPQSQPYKNGEAHEGSAL
jgi:ABC-type bacteriocin/lantibiotic exporter with double-glycine peptidase domain